MGFQEILGQEDAVLVLSRSLENDRLAHAYVFSGPEGVGKALTALALAGALLCPMGPMGPMGPERPRAANLGCGVCPTCRRVVSRSHPDLIILEVLPDKKEISIDQVRDAQSAVSLRAYEGRKKVLIVNAADRLNSSAANAFLKTLEEPPEDTIIVLVTSQPHLLLPTIRSRCQEVRFRSLSDEIVARFLVERKGLDRARAAMLAAVSAGSLGKALAGEPGEAAARRDSAIDVLARVAAEPLEERAALAESLAKGEGEADALLEWTDLVVRDLLMASAGRADRLVNVDRAEDLERIAERIPTSALLGLAEEIGRARTALRWRGNPRLVLDVFLQSAAAIMAVRTEAARP